MSQVNARVTRAERQAATRESLIAQARSMFLDIGYAGTSLDRVAIEAGFSKGAVYSNFGGKEELCLAVLDDIHAEKVRGVTRIFAGQGDLGEKLDEFVRWAQEELVDPRWTALEFEFAAVAGKSEWFAAQLAERHREVAGLIQNLVEHISAEVGLRGIETAQRTAVTLLSVGIGLGALKSLDPQIDMNVLGDLIRTMIKASSTKPETLTDGDEVQ